MNWLLFGEAHAAERIAILYTLIESCRRRGVDPYAYLLTIAKLGGYLARASDAPPGNTSMWRGVSRLTDIHLGLLLAKGDVDN